MWGLLQFLILAPRPGSTQLPANSSPGRLRPNNQQDRNTATPIKNKKERDNKKICYRWRNKVKTWDQINEEEILNLPEKELRVMIVKMIQNLRNRMEGWIKKTQEMFNKNLEEIKNKQWWGLPWWRSGWDFACQRRGHGFEPWYGKIPHATEQLSSCTTTTEPELWSPWATTTEARTPRACAPQQEKPPQWEACAPQQRIAPACHN